MPHRTAAFVMIGLAAVALRGTAGAAGDVHENR